MMRNMSRAIPRLWKDGYKQFTGLEEAIMKNCEAASGLAACVRTSFGPNGLSKIVINRIEKVIVTTDAATIISELEVQHPAAKLLCLSAAMQQREIGDGANFVVVFAGELLKNAVYNLRKGLHPSVLVRGYEMAAKKVQEMIKELVVYEVNSQKDMYELEKLKLGIKSAISSKQYGLENFLSELVGKACLNSMPQIASNFIVDNIRTVKILGGSIMDSQIIKGMVLESAPKSACTYAESTKVAIFTCSLDSTQTETKGTVLLHDANELMNYNQSEEDFIHGVIKRLKEMGVGVVIVGEKISEMAIHYADKYKLVLLRCISKWTLRRLCRAVRARPVVTLQGIRDADLGVCNKVYTKEIGNDNVTIFEQVNIGDSEVSTIVIRGATETAMNDVERAVDDGVNMVRAMTRNGKFVAGAGAVEIELARRLNQYAATVAGVEQYAVKAYAKSLEVVPRTLAENTGLNDTDIISKLYKAHSEQKDDKQSKEEPATGDNNNNKISKEILKDIKESPTNIGVDIVNGGVRDMTREGVIDLMATRQMGIKLATQSATTILRVDHIIMKKPAGGPRKPNRGHWDDNDETW
eukprot:CAMPEP_0201578474 /NCGR_PEP_ID=MMETSP0190_2-20130828/25357_1 /ASSEMBLY_ACC=CAM_ASM_000263 /TAXON_ID=37353 /ORGANISM="Rosalina sp." /LENGTH=580 /DNA_ID=CAMNT_0048011695 /DNA_START=155 /DNA_END=1897 /DNA_ORIENTATION=+